LNLRPTTKSWSQPMALSAHANAVLQLLVVPYAGSVALLADTILTSPTPWRAAHVDRVHPGTPGPPHGATPPPTARTEDLVRVFIILMIACPPHSSSCAPRSPTSAAGSWRTPSTPPSSTPPKPACTQCPVCRTSNSCTSWVGHRMRAEVAVLVDARLTDAAINVSTAGPHGEEQHQRLTHHD